VSNFEEKRSAIRINVNCEINCKLLGSETLYKAVCISLSGSGISFISEQPFEVDSDVEVIISPDTVMIPVLRFYISIVRCQAVDNNNFQVGAIILQPNEID
jgi:PilZ domain